MTPTLTTEQLLLLPLQLEDAEQMQPLFAVWENVKLLNAAVPWPYPPDGVYTHFRDVALPAVERGEGWYWTLRLKTRPEQIIGSILLQRTEGNNRGFWLGSAWQRRGLMTGAVEALNEFWFETLGMQVLRAPKAAVNVGSIGVSERTGMRLESEQEQDFVSGKMMGQTWVMTREDWLRHKQKRRASR